MDFIYFKYFNFEFEVSSVFLKNMSLFDIFVIFIVIWIVFVFYFVDEFGVLISLCLRNFFRRSCNCF